MAPTDRPPRAAWVLATLIVGAIAANVNLSIGNVALPDIGRELGASQVQQTMVASMFTMGLAASVLYLGAIGDRYGRKLLLLLGAGLSIPAALIAGLAPNVEVLIGGRLLGGLAAGLLFPTTLSLISALWRGAALTRAIAVWSGCGGMAVAIGQLLGGLLLRSFPWGSVFLVTVPLAVVVLVLGWVVVPWHAGEGHGAVDHLGGVLSALGIALLVISIQRLPEGIDVTIAVEFCAAVVLLAWFLWWQRRARRPLVDLHAAGAPTFWVAAAGGMITFGALIGALFLGQQFTQNVLGYSALASAAANLPSPVMLLITSVVAARLIQARGGRSALTVGIVFIAASFATMLLFWGPDAGPLGVLAAYALVGAGVGFAGTAASHSLMASLPVSRAGMGSAFTDLTRDFGGAIMQALMGTILAIVYANSLRAAFRSLTPAEAAEVSDQAAEQIVSSFQGAEQVASGYPQVQAQELVEAASRAFTNGKTAAYLVGLAATVCALVLVRWRYPDREAEQRFFVAIEDVDRREAAEAAGGTLSG